MDSKTGIDIDIYPGKKSSFHFTLGAYFGGSSVIKAKNKERGIFKGISEYNDYVEQHPNAGLDPIGVEFDDNYLLKPDADGNVEGDVHVSVFVHTSALAWAVPSPATAWASSLTCERLVIRSYMTSMSSGYPNEEPPYAEPHVRWCDRTMNTKIGDKHL